MSPKTIAIIQARMGSTRLPGKVLMDVAGRPLLARVVERVRRASCLDQVVVATSTGAGDNALCAWCQEQQIACVRGSEDDVLGRFLDAARVHEADICVRITGDCPLHDGRVIDRVVERFLEGDLDFANNTIRYTWPQGLDTEVISRAALESAAAEAQRPSDREHVTAFFYRYPSRFRLGNVALTADEDFSQYNWSVDLPTHLALTRAVYAALPEGFGWREVAALLTERPDLRALATRTGRRNPGFSKSLAQDTALSAPPARIGPAKASLAKASAGHAAGGAARLAVHATRVRDAVNALARAHGLQSWFLCLGDPPQMASTAPDGAQPWPALDRTIAAALAQHGIVAARGAPANWDDPETALIPTLRAWESIAAALREAIFAGDLSQATPSQATPSQAPGPPASEP